MRYNCGARPARPHPARTVVVAFLGAMTQVGGFGITTLASLLVSQRLGLRGPG